NRTDKGYNETTVNNTNTYINASSTADGIYDWWVNCTDGTNENKSEVRIITVDITPPSVSYHASADESGSASKTWVLVNVTISDALSGIHTVQLEWEGVNESFAFNDGTNWWSNKSGLGEANYTFKAWVNDSAGNNNNTTERWVNLDTTGPTITFDTPPTPNNETVAVTYAEINVTIGESVTSAMLEWDGVNESMDGSGVDWYLNKTTLANANYTFTVYANDSLNNLGFSFERWVYINSASNQPPTVNLTTPINLTNTTDTTPEHGFNFTDPDNTSANCTLYYNGTDKGYNASTDNNTNTYINASSTSDGIYDWWVNCTDGENEVKSDMWTITIDTTGPTVTFVEPTPNNETITYNWAYVNVTTTDALLSVESATLDWNSTNESMSDGGSGADWWLNKTSLANGNYTFRVWANDSLNNSGVSVERWVYINVTPDPLVLEIFDQEDDSEIYPPPPAGYAEHTVTANLTTGFWANYTNNSIGIYPDPTSSLVQDDMESWDSGETYIYGLFSIDVDGDGAVELISTGHNVEDPYPAEVHIWNYTDGGLVNEANLTNIDDGTTRSWDVYASDVDNDGTIEILTCGMDDGASKAGVIHIFNYTSGTIQEEAQSRTSGDFASMGIYTHDLDGDGAIEIIVTSTDDTNKVMRLEVFNYTDGVINSEVSTTFGTDIRGEYLFIIDIDNDGTTEILTTAEQLTANQGELHIWNYTGGTLNNEVNTTWALERTVKGLHAADVDKDGAIEIFVTGWEPGTTPNVDAELRVWNYTSGTLNQEALTSWPQNGDTRSQAMDINDIDFDGELEILTTGFEATAGQLKVEIQVWNYTGGTLNNEENITWSDERVRDIYVADLNNDGTIEIFTGGRNQGAAGGIAKVFVYNYSNSTCNIWFNDTEDWSGMFWDSTYSFYNYTRNFSSTGTYEWNVSCFKSGFATKNNESTLTVQESGAPSNTAPVVNLVSPPNDTNTTDNTTTHTFNFTDNENLTANCTLYYNSTPYGYNESTDNNTNTNITANASVPEGFYLWWVNCTDGELEANSTKWTINISSNDQPVINWVNDTPDPVVQGDVVNITANITDVNGQGDMYTVRFEVNGTNYTYEGVDGSVYWYASWDTNVPPNMYNYTVYANDSVGNNATPVSGNFTVETTTVDLTLPVNLVDFNITTIGQTNNTTDGNPSPFILQNDGNVKVNITVYASAALFANATLNSTNFQVKADNSSGESNTFNWDASQINWTNMSDTELGFINELLCDNSTDEAQSEILITVPLEEPEGSKSTSVIYIASDGR
ncbi:MAG: VCBS repeat-containing protein, partial [archaeon]